MDGVTPAWAAEYQRAHPGVRIWVNWRGLFAWRQGADDKSRELAHAETRKDLLEKLGG